MATTKKNPNAKTAKRASPSAARSTRKAVARSTGKAVSQASGKRPARATGKGTGRSAAKGAAAARKAGARLVAKTAAQSAGKRRLTARAGAAKRATAPRPSRTPTRKAAPVKAASRATGPGAKPRTTLKPQKTQKVTTIPTVKQTKGNVAVASAPKAPAPAKAQKPAAKPTGAATSRQPKLKVVTRGAAQPVNGATVAGAKPLAAKAPPPASVAPAHNFQVGDHVVYPSHGVGKIIGIETHTIGEQKLQMFVISFEKERMTLRVPVAKISSAGMRRLSSPAKMDAAVTALKGRARARRVMWSRRAQEYEAKLNSGDPVSIAEVVRDLHRNVGQPDQSYSERQMYEAALERLAREFAAVEKIDTDQAAERLEKVLRAA
jgi:CarD family transcriptional regulator